MGNNDTTTALYNGRHTVDFRKNSHRYFIDGQAKPGVTTIINKTLAKPDLMLWPLDMAIKYLTPLLPTVTEADLDGARQAHAKRRDKGADTGTIIHSLVEQYLRVGIVDLTPYSLNPEVMAAFDGFQTWQEAAKPEVVAVEQVVYSDQYDYAGTFDSILRINGKTYLCDLKTTNTSRSAPQGIYAEYFVQLGAYYYAYEEQRQYELANGGTNLVKIDDLMVLSCKKNGAVDVITAADALLDLDECTDIWIRVYHVYRYITQIKSYLQGATT